MDIIGEKIKERKEIENLLENAIENKMNLTKKSDKCKSYVKENYDSEKIIPKIIESACASNFMSFETDVYRHPLMRVIARRLVAMIRWGSNIINSRKGQKGQKDRSWPVKGIWYTRFGLIVFAEKYPPKSKVVYII